MQEKFIDSNDALICLRTDGIIHVTFKANLTLDIPAQMRLLDLYNQIAGGVKRKMVYCAEDGVTITKEARDNATKLEDISPNLASAVVANNLAYKLIADFYYKVNKPKRPFKVFTNLDDALKWLHSI